MSTFFTSDLHFGHQNIIPYCNRPWNSAEAMNQGLVDRWNDVVTAKDAVFVLGDLCWGAPSKYVDWLKQLRGYKYLIPGNHDTVWPGHKKRSGGKALMEAGFVVLPERCLRSFGSGNLPAWLCHFPHTVAFNGDKRFKEHFPPKDHWLIHGHVHTTWQVDVPNRQFNVGVDVWDWYPVHEDTITEAIREAA